MSLTPSKYQKAVYDFIQDGTGNAVINAVAGSGKTTTIVTALELIPADKKVIFLAFNKAIVQELTTRVPKHVTVKTLHSLGWSSIIYSYKAHKPALNDYKYHQFISQMREDWKEDADYGFRVKKLVDLLRVNLLPTFTSSDTIETKQIKINALEELAIKHDIEIYNCECQRAFEVVQMLAYKKNEFDFTDMLYIPATNDNVTMFKYDYIFVDESQDLSVAQQALLKKIMHSGSRFIAVGDPRQSIYGFAGADIDSFNKLRAFPNTIELPLSVNYRCGKNIIALAQTIVPQLEAFEEAIDGELDYQASVHNIKEGDFVLCRNTAPLVKLCLEFLADEKKASVKGMDIGKSLINLILKAKTEDIEVMNTFLANELFRIMKKLQIKFGTYLTENQIKDMPSYRIMVEKVKIIEIIAESISAKICQDIINKINEIFKDESKGILLSTIHKAKGLESENVFIIERHLMPSKYAKQDWQKEQETNLEYVAYTRAKRYLGFVHDWSFKRGDF